MRYVRANISFNVHDHCPVSDLVFIKVLPSNHISSLQLVRHPLEHKLPPCLLPTLPRSAVLQIALVLALALLLTEGVDLIRNQDLKKLHFSLANCPTVP